MILYLDTSALVKLFVVEAHSEKVRQSVSGARLVVTHAIAYAEACATFARVVYARGDDSLFAALRGNLDIQWASWEILNVTEPLIRRAADLAARYRLRGYDSIHLAAAESAFEVFRNHLPFHFAVFDGQLSDAAKQAGIPLLDA
ncbi:MAG: type II toxin-antitoxin system VapC family toxin [Burkholderiales bacterium]